MPDKLLTIREASDLLGISEQKIRRLVKKGGLPAYKVGGKFLRFRREQVEAIRTEIPAKKPPEKPREAPPKKEYTRNLKDASYQEAPVDSVLDFFYFNDFYIIAGAITLLILWGIFRF